MRTYLTKYPDYSAELAEIDKNGINEKIIRRIINRHKYNAAHSKELIDRYEVLKHGVPIFNRKPRFSEDAAAVNNKINDDFFGEIVDFKVGYFAGKPIGYSYSTTEESRKETGSDEKVKNASKTLTDFITRNNMYDVDMEATKYAAICGYAGRLFFIDPEGNERCIVIKPNEAVVLTDLEVTEPKYAVRYYQTKDIYNKTLWHAEFYDSENIYYYEGGSVSKLELIEVKPHLFDFCPLQIIPNNKEMMGDAEKVLELIDAYDRGLSDCNNELESFARAYMVYKNITADDKSIERAQSSGAFEIDGEGDVFFLTKNINDTFTENHLTRLEDNIYRFSKTPNLNDEKFNSASGIALKFKLTGVETKCGMFQAKMQAAGTYMFKLIASSLHKKRIDFEPLQCVMDFKRNFPLDILSEAQAAQNLIAAGLPRQVAYSLAVSGIDDIDYVMQLIEEEENSIPPLIGGDEDEDEL